ncbi:MAG: L-seryl-tRNA(Sec) selenium transferase [Chloroflexi bacterium]|nr:L-seryl-tRNA(Sec) selenium transferase [Chloroflexota bacterium]
MKSPFKSLPSVEKVLSDNRVETLVQRYSRQVVVDLVRSEIDTARQTILDGYAAPDFDRLVQAIEESAETNWREWPVHVINATGVILHTNLGRAPLSREATDAARRAALGYSDLELDLDTGRRGSRQAHISNLMAEVTGAEAAIVVNNNASALLLGLAALASGKEVIVSRGEAVEIGGGFRVPDVLRQSGATLIEVGTTNRTYARDFEEAITENTGAILAVHASNFRITGFTHAPELSELVELGARHSVVVLHDLGSGCLLDTTAYGLAHEPMAQESIQAGVGLGFFSGDKLLGGPQAGIIAGKRQLIDIVARHPLARAVRIDKMSMAALAATVLHYIKGEAEEKVPIWRMIAMPEGEVASTAERWQAKLGGQASVESAMSTIGGGSLPGETIGSWVVVIDCRNRPGGAEALANALRHGDTPVIGRIEDERVLLDPRTVLPEEEEPLLAVVTDAIRA